MRERALFLKQLNQSPKGSLTHMRYLVPLRRIIGEICPKESFLLAYFLASGMLKRRKTSVWMKSKKYLKAGKLVVGIEAILNLLNF